MAEPTVTINNSTGSDTAASGAGPATALTGTNASFAGTPSVVTLDGSPDLTNVATDGSHVCWVKTSTGRQYSKITAKDNVAKTVTVADTLAGTATGRTWAIGGKRKAMTHADTAVLFANSGGIGDAKAGWAIDIQDDPATFTAAFNVLLQGSPGQPVMVISSSVTRPTLTTATNSLSCIFDISGSRFLQLRHLKFTNTAATKGTAGSSGASISVLSASARGLVIDDCIFDGPVHAVLGDNITVWNITSITITRSEIANCTSDGVRIRDDVRCNCCYIHNNGGHGLSANGGFGPCLTNTVFANNTGSGYRNIASGALDSTNGVVTVCNCTFSANGSDGLTFSHAGTGTANGGYCLFSNNIFYGNTGYGINFATATSSWSTVAQHNNAFGANGAGATNNLPAGLDEVTLTANPFNSASDFGLNSTAGGGSAAKAAAARPLNASANTAGDVGAVPSGGGAAASSGGGSGTGKRIGPRSYIN